MPVVVEVVIGVWGSSPVLTMCDPYYPILRRAKHTDQVPHKKLLCKR